MLFPYGEYFEVRLFKNGDIPSQYLGSGLARAKSTNRRLAFSFSIAHSKLRKSAHACKVLTTALVKEAEYPRAAYTEGRRVRVRGRGFRGSAYATRVRPRTALRVLAAY